MDGQLGDSEAGTGDGGMDHCGAGAVDDGGEDVVEREWNRRSW